MGKIYMVWFSEQVKEFLACLIYGGVSPDDMRFNARTHQSHVCADSKEEAIKEHRRLRANYYKECDRILFKDTHKEVRVKVSPACYNRHTLEVRCEKFDYITSTVFFIRDMLSSEYEEILRELGRHVPYLLSKSNLNNPPCFNTWEEGFTWLRKDENIDEKVYRACKDAETWDLLNRELLQIKPGVIYEKCEICSRKEAVLRDTGFHLCDGCEESIGKGMDLSVRMGYLKKRI